MSPRIIPLPSFTSPERHADDMGLAWEPWTGSEGLGLESCLFLIPLYDSHISPSVK